MHSQGNVTDIARNTNIRQQSSCPNDRSGSATEEPFHFGSSGTCQGVYFLIYRMGLLEEPCFLVSSCFYIFHYLCNPLKLCGVSAGYLN